jgi:cellobiose epimerase
MKPATREALITSLAELKTNLAGIAGFWRPRAVDPLGGFFTNYDAHGRRVEDAGEKLLNTQMRVVWGFSLLHASSNVPRDDGDLPKAAAGAHWLIDHFWDQEHGGWIWRSDRQGRRLDGAKLTYGQSFALYAMADYARVSGDARAREYALKTFDVIQTKARDPQFPQHGFLENLLQDFSPEPPERAGDLKSLDIHMHLMESFTSLYLLTGEVAHRDALEEVIQLILTHMIDHEHGCGGDQYTRLWRPRPTMQISRTWLDDRPDAQAVKAAFDSQAADLTCYGHNLELGWLLARADQALGRPRDAHGTYIRRIAEHTLRYGLDTEFGGLFRQGPHDGPATVQDKEFWQNMEALPGFLEAYQVTGQDIYLDAFLNVWRFAHKHMINHELGEWRQHLARDGSVLDGTLGNPWKVFYHSARAVDESITRLESEILR